MSLVPGIWLVLLLALGSAPFARAAAGASEPATADAYIERADARLEAHAPDHAGAASDYASAYAAMPPEARVGELGQFVVVAAVRLRFEHLWPATKDPAHLVACESLAAAYVRDLDAARAARRPLPSEPSSDETYIRETLVAARAEREAAAEAPRAEREARPREAEPRPESPRLAPVPTDAPPARRDTVATAMTSVGTLLVVGGAALAIDGLLFPSMIAKAKAEQRARDELEGDLAPDDPDPSAYREREERMRERGRNLVIGGSVSLAIGVGLVAWGCSRFARKRSRAADATARIVPRFGRDEAGMSISFRF